MATVSTTSQRLSHAGRDGKTPLTALLSIGLDENPEEELYYLVLHIGSQWVLATEPEAKYYHSVGFTVYHTKPIISNDVSEMSKIEEWVDAMPSSPEGSVAEQISESKDIANKAAGSGEDSTTPH